MSVSITIPYNAENFVVNITNDGKFSIVSVDMEYELAFSAMGGHDTNAMVLLKGLQMDPANYLCQSTGLDHTTLSLLVVDWANHVAHLAHRHQSEITGGITAARDFVAKKIDAETLEEEVQYLKDILARDGGHVARAAYHAVQVPLCSMDPASVGYHHTLTMAIKTAWNAEWAAEHAVAEQNYTHENVVSAAAAERAWQVRRFVHVMEALQAGKKWPPIEATP